MIGTIFRCKECEKYLTTKDPQYGVCCLPESYFPTEAESECVYLKVNHDITCGECTRFGNDFACLDAKVDDDATGCIGFEDAIESVMTEVLFKWLQRGEYSREKVLSICEAFENTNEYKFVKKHIEE